MLSFVCCFGVSFSAQGGQNGWSQALVWNLHLIVQIELHFTLQIFEENIDARTSSFSFLLEYCWFYSFFLFCFTSICVFVSLPALSCFRKIFFHFFKFLSCKFSGQFPIDCCQWNTVFHISLFYQKIEEVRIILTDHYVVFVLNNQLLFCEFVNVFHIFSLCPIYNMFLNFHLNSVSFMSKDIQLISKP